MKADDMSKSMIFTMTRLEERPRGFSGLYNSNFTMKVQEAELQANADWQLSCIHAALSKTEP